ncbi:hypothetical protein ACM39_15675 [Chryseobacterium sp. FH2]|uniref:zinc-dependent metalloprotease n=1 Tax=Chryseobacterium sp. FH2 TaxID=1674291 RepID=UPI00065A9EFD|nr:GEVED domain-containing protein [Chryseobacterium sp. FH2]KMQ67208.1 hypothetical protein ACM39_15675 [Chryseobacterium sp. FH2]
MKRTLLYGFMLFSLSLSAQQQRTCGFDEDLALQDRQNPGMRQAFDKIVNRIREEREKNPSVSTAKLVNGIYEIPVVVHVIYPSGAAVGTTYNKSDADIQAWIERANQMYAGTYAWPASGVPADFGQSAVFPIRLVLAKRTPGCEATTGIVRYDGGSLSGYNASGMAYTQTLNGASRTAIKNLAPHWPEDSYFNIYVISMFDGDASPNSGLMGFAAFPNNLNANYESFMKSGVVTNAHDTTFAHEFGHAMGLYHTFQGADYDLLPTDADYCPPTTNNCAVDDDMVCDTERAGSGYAIYPPANSTINPCTGTNYQGVQYNMMNYTNSVAQKFTTGQGDRINDLFMMIRSSLTTSKGATALPSTSTNHTPVPASCNPPGVNNPSTANFYLAGPTFVKLGDIDNSSSGGWPAAPQFYIDYTTKECLVNSHTQLTVNQLQTIQVGIFQNSQSVKVWIDYNNNGTFETSELVTSGNNIPLGSDLKGTFTGTFTPPASAVMNTPLRMRVIADYNTPASILPCGQLNYGQAEDYSVTIVSTLGTSETKADSNDLVIYPNPSSAGDKVFIKAKNGKNLKVTISDMSGRLIESPSITEENNGTYRVNHNLQKGVYMVQISNGKENKTSKLIIK